MHSFLSVHLSLQAALIPMLLHFPACLIALPKKRHAENNERDERAETGELEIRTERDESKIDKQMHTLEISASTHTRRKGPMQ